MRPGVTDRVGEEFRLLRDAGELAVHDKAPQLHDGISNGDETDGCLPVLLVEIVGLSFEFLSPVIDCGLKVFDLRVVALGIVGDAAIARRDIERIPRSLHEQPQFRIVLQPQFGEFRDALVGDQDVRGHREDIDLAAGQSGLSLVLRVLKVPMLDDARAADPLLSDQLVPLNPRQLHKLFHTRRDKHVEAVPGVEDSQSVGLLRVLGLSGTGVRQHQYAREKDDQRPNRTTSTCVSCDQSHDDFLG